MLRSWALLALATCLNCDDQVPPGLAPLVVKVADGQTFAPLCNATVTINMQPAQEGSPTTVNCYYTPATSLAVGSTYTATAALAGYVTVSTTGIISSQGSTVTLQLARLGDAGVDASEDAASDASDASEDVEDGSTDAELDASLDGDSE